METTRTERFRRAIDRSIARVRFKPEYQVANGGAWQTVRRHLNPFNGSVVSAATCWALFIVWIAAGIYVIPFTAIWSGRNEVGIMILFGVLTHMIGFVLFAKIVMAFLAPLFALIGRDERLARDLSDDMRFMGALTVFGLFSNGFWHLTETPGVLANNPFAGFDSYVSFPVLVLIMMLTTVPSFMLVPISGLVMQFLGTVIHEFRTGPPRP